jgi:hypothetical protein
MSPSRESFDPLVRALHGDEDAQHALAEDVCECAGHDWADAGGGMQMCVNCATERDDPDA